MEPLFNLYGNTDEIIATQTQITDEDIKKAKQLKQLSLHESIVNHEILSPRDEPDTDLLDHCSDVILKVLNAYAARQDRDSLKMKSAMNGQPFTFKAKALHKMLSDANPTIIDTVHKLEMQPDAVLNCIAVTYHYEHTPEELGSDAHPLDPAQIDDRPFYRKHPIITALGVMAVVLLVKE